MTLLALRWPRRRAASLLLAAVRGCAHSFTLAGAVDGHDGDSTEPAAEASSGASGSEETGPVDEAGGVLAGSFDSADEVDSGARGDGSLDDALDVAESVDAGAFNGAGSLDVTQDVAASVDAATSPTLLDDFNRPDGPVLGAWAGNDLDAFAIEGGRLVVKKDGCYTIFFTSSIRHLAQQSRVTLQRIPNAASETNLVLRARTATGCELIEANYQPSRRLIGVFGCEESTSGAVWTDGGPQTAVAFLPEHVLAATVDANGAVNLFDGNMTIGSYVAPNWARRGKHAREHWHQRVRRLGRRVRRFWRGALTVQHAE